MCKQTEQRFCQHDWVKSYEQRLVHGRKGWCMGTRTKWTCKKCGKISWG